MSERRNEEAVKPKVKESLMIKRTRWQTNCENFNAALWCVLGQQIKKTKARSFLVRFVPSCRCTYTCKYVCILCISAMHMQRCARACVWKRIHTRIKQSVCPGKVHEKKVPGKKNDRSEAGRVMREMENNVGCDACMHGAKNACANHTFAV